MQSVIEQITFACLRVGDVAIGRNGSETTITGIEPLADGRMCVRDAKNSYRVQRTWTLRVRRTPVEAKCDRCSGRGEYWWGAMVNGKPSHTGVCFHCEGKGWQSEQDRVRNANYARYAIRF